MKRLSLATTMCLTLSGMVYADPGDVWIDVNGLSYHTKKHYGKKKDKDYNYLNYGVGVRYEVANWVEVLGGYYTNSFDKSTFYAGGNPKYTFGDESKFHVSPGVTIGIATGYGNTPVKSDLIPIAMPNVRFGYNRVAASVGFIPSVKETVSDIITFQLNFRL